jgi:hypothetical protein
MNMVFINVSKRYFQRQTMTKSKKWPWTQSQNYVSIQLYVNGLFKEGFWKFSKDIVISSDNPTLVMSALRILGFSICDPQILLQHLEEAETMFEYIHPRVQYVETRVWHCLPGDLKLVSQPKCQLVETIRYVQNFLDLEEIGLVDKEKQLRKVLLQNGFDTHLENLMKKHEKEQRLGSIWIHFTEGLLIHLRKDLRTSISRVHKNQIDKLSYLSNEMQKSIENSHM